MLRYVANAGTSRGESAKSEKVVSTFPTTISASSACKLSDSMPGTHMLAVNCKATFSGSGKIRGVSSTVIFTNAFYAFQVLTSCHYFEGVSDHVHGLLSIPGSMPGSGQTAAQSSGPPLPDVCIPYAA